SGRVAEMHFRREIAHRLAAAGGSVDEVDTDTYLAMVTALHDRLRSRRPGSINRPDEWWRLRTQDPPSMRDGATPMRCVVSYAEDGRVDGHATYRVKGQWQYEVHAAETIIEELEAESVA